MTDMLVRGDAIAAMRTPAACAAWASLTHAELDIAEWLITGMSNREIATCTCRSIATIEAHVGHILRKLGFTHRTQVAVAAVVQHYITGDQYGRDDEPPGGPLPPGVTGFIPKGPVETPVSAVGAVAPSELGWPDYRTDRSAT
jgi:DNA-binding CsgD family transcriptional regulator